MCIRMNTKNKKAYLKLNCLFTNGCVIVLAFVMAVYSFSLPAFESNNVDSAAQTCPEQFHSVNIPETGKLCQIFGSNFPASMIFFVPKPPEVVLNDFTQNSDMFTEAKRSKGRYLLSSKDNNTTIIISHDGQGTQVDVLVKQELTLAAKVSD